jgi:hypothetical protein
LSPLKNNSLGLLLLFILPPSLDRSCRSSSTQTLADRTEFEYGEEEYVLDRYPDLFAGSQLGNSRRALFEEYLANSVEGRERSQRAGTSEGEKVWATLTVEEATTFLAVTAAMANLEVENGVNLMQWIDSLEEIHGENALLSGERYKNDQAFRILVKLTPDAISHIEDGKGHFNNLCKSEQVGYDGLGSTHPDYCRPDERFDKERKTDNHPNLQFNFSVGPRCADIDIDYRRGFTHLTLDNSNVLASKQVLDFEKEYCDPGFQLKP